MSNLKNETLGPLEAAEQALQISYQIYGLEMKGSAPVIRSFRNLREKLKHEGEVLDTDSQDDVLDFVIGSLAEREKLFILQDENAMGLLTRFVILRSSTDDESMMQAYEAQTDRSMKL